VIALHWSGARTIEGKPGRTANYCPELSNIARPVVPFELGKGSWHEHEEPELVERSLCEKRQVLEPNAQWRHLQDHVLSEPVVEVLSQATTTNRNGEIFVRRRDEARVDLVGPRCSEPPAFTILEQPQELRLVGDGHRGHLVQDEQPLRGKLCCARAIERTREGTLHGPEELALEMIWGHRRAVEDDETTRHTGCGVQRARDEILADAALAANEHASKRELDEHRDLAFEGRNRPRSSKDQWSDGCQGRSRRAAAVRRGLRLVVSA
jgi:hypothetical protein